MSLHAKQSSWTAYINAINTAKIQNDLKSFRGHDMFVLNKQNKCNSIETEGRTGTYWIQAGVTDYMEMFLAVNNRDTHISF